MSIPEFLIELQSPSISEFAELRASANWPNAPVELMQHSLDNSLFHVCIRLKQKKSLVAMGRVIGDGALYFYLQDIVVHPDFQGNGMGDLVMQEIENYLHATASQGATIGLLSVKGKEAFYARYGYLERAGDSLGLGMCKFI